VVLLAGIVGADSEAKLLHRIIPDWRWIVWVKNTSAAKQVFKMFVPFLGIFWLKDSAAAKPLPALGWWAFWLVQLQGLLGGLRVVLDAHVFAGAKMGMVFGLFHGCLAQAFFVVLCVIALFTSRWWKRENTQHPTSNIQHPMLPASLRRLVLFTTIVISFQLIIGATMRHQHAGLAIPDFPLAYGKLWPDTSTEAVIHYNQQRMEITAANSITSFQVVLQMAHRIMAMVILICVGVAAWRVRSSGFSRSGPPKGGTPNLQIIPRLTIAWLGLILVQASLGAWTIWSDKAGDIATLHVVVGALSLVTGALLCIIIFSGPQTKSERTEVFSSSSQRP
jgi:cytochrome c oxidase assembly protein subunit 15